MKEYSDAMSEKIKTDIQTLHRKFMNDDLSKGLTEEQRDESGFITDVFAEAMYNYYLQTPGEWKNSALEEVCLDVMPRKVSAGAEFFSNVQPVLTAFFAFLQQHGIITNGTTLANKLKKVAPVMVKVAADSANWGTAKQLFMEGIESGLLDTSSEENLRRSMKKYIDEVNLKNAKNTKPDMLKNIGRNDPCPCGSGKKYKKCCQGKVIPFPVMTQEPDESKPLVYQIKVSIMHIKPLVWRRLLVPAGITFNKLHKIIQAAFGWQDYHLYEFDFGDVLVNVPDPEYPLGAGVMNLNAKREKIDALLPSRKKCVYTYDFGDNWRHEIILEQITNAEEETRYPVCIEGAGHRPPEDVGGPPGYEEFLKIIGDHDNPEQDDYLEWAEKDTGGRKFLPDYFYLQETNRALAKIK